jgi:hypothetical protein
MSVRAELVVVRGEELVHVEPVGPLGVRLGRAPGNDLVLADAAVSAHHAVVSWDAGHLVVTDLASRNGTTVDGARVSGKVPLLDGARLELGGAVALRVRLRAGAAELPAWEVEVGGVVRIPVRQDRLRVGSAPGADVHVAGPGVVGLVLVVGDELRLATDDDDLLLPEGVPVEVAGTTLTARRADAALAATVPLARTSWTYALRATLRGPTGPSAELADPVSGRSHRVDTENRAVLLWLLGSRWRQDQGLHDEDRGWCGDDELLSGLWGREGASADPTRLRVLLCRLRKELGDAGLDGSCLEKRQGHLRVRLGRAELVT